MKQWIECGATLIMYWDSIWFLILMISLFNQRECGDNPIRKKNLEFKVFFIKQISARLSQKITI